MYSELGNNVFLPESKPLAQGFLRRKGEKIKWTSGFAGFNKNDFLHKYSYEEKENRLSKGRFLIVHSGLCQAIKLFLNV